MSDTNYFSSEYQPVSQTTIVDQPEQIDKIECPESEFERYGISKPKRVIIQAKLLNGKN